MGCLWSDVRYGFRVLRKSPGFTAVAMLTLALGIGANSTVFSWIDTVLLRPLPGVEEPSRLVALETLTPSGEYITTSYPNYRDLRDRNRLLAGLAGAQLRSLNLGDGERTERVWAEMVTGNYFAVLGVKPALGRVFAPEEYGGKIGGYPVAVIGDGLWKRSFRADPGIAGKTIRLSGCDFTVIGVTPPGFHGSMAGLAFDVWVPFVMKGRLTGADDSDFEQRKARPLRVIARLKPEATMQQAGAEIQAIAAELARAYPATNQGVGAVLLPLWEAHLGAQAILAAPLKILMAICGVVLLIVCSNVANLLLARSAVRRKEFSLRLALGAGRGRLVRQLLTESALLALGGAALGLTLSYWMSDALRLLLPATSLPVVLDLRLDPRMLGFTALVAGLTALVFGMAPALQSLKPDLQEALKEGGRNATAGAGSLRLRGLLVISEVALALVALIGTGLFVKSFERARNINPGFDPRHVMLAELELPLRGPTRAQGLEFFRRLRERLEAAPGIRSIGYADYVPLGFGPAPWREVQVEGYVPRAGESMRVNRNVVSPGYFGLMRIPLVEGRDFSEHDNAESPRVTIVNQTFVRRFLPHRNPIGRKVLAGDTWSTIIGVAKGGKYISVTEAPLPYMYLAFLQRYDPGDEVTAHIRTVGAPGNALATLRREAQSLDPRVAIFNAIPLADHIEGSLYGQKVAASLLSALGSLALLLAAVGLYSLMAYSIAQRTHEIGIRMALGARPEDVLRMVVRQGMILTLAGVVLGLGAALALTRLIAPTLLTVSPTDPAVFLGVAAFLAAIALAASYLPARRATKVDPMIALRCQ